MDFQRGKYWAAPLLFYASHDTFNGSWWWLKMWKWTAEKKHPATEEERKPQFIPVTAVS